MIPQNLDLNTLGRFQPAKIDGRRCRVFIGNDGRVGCSRKFSRVEAYNNSLRVVTLAEGETVMVSYLRSRGFPVTENSEIDDATATAIDKELRGVIGAVLPNVAGET